MLWDESFLWGVMAYKAVEACGFSCDLIRSEDVRNGRLKDYALLVVPGGWASNKIKSLGDEGVDAIKRFVHDGGAYLGVCGGAGLATQDGIGLVPVKRRPTKERVPSFSGRIKLKVQEHPLWKGFPACGNENTELRTPNSELVFNAWWPSQFVIDSGSVTVLATYGEAMHDSFSSDVNVGDAEALGNWAELERIYRINLDPKRLLGEPAVIEGMFGKGKVLLSLVHFDTPDDGSGALMLKNSWEYLVPNEEYGLQEEQGRVCNVQTTNFEIIAELEEATNGLIALGKRNFLWFWRNPMLLQWRRGVRGLEYCTLHVMVNELAALVRRADGKAVSPALSQGLERTRDLLLPFVDKAKHLLVRERFAMQNAHITYERCDDPEIQVLREELFSRSKSHGGLFKTVINEVDNLIWSAKTGC